MPIGRNLRELKGHKDEVTCLAFSPDGRFLASGSEDQDVILWSLSDGSRLAALEDHPGHVTSLAITPDSRTIVVGSKDGSVTLWTCTPEPRATLGGDSKANPTPSRESQPSSPDPIRVTSGETTEKSIPPPETSDPNLKELLAYLGSGGPAEIETDWNVTCVNNRARLYEALAADPKSPSLTRFFLKPNVSAANAPYLIVTTGERSQFDRDWNYRKDEIRDRVLGELSLPVGAWAPMTGEGSASYANHSKPGCSLASTANYDNLRKIQQGQYTLERVVRPAHAAQKPVQREVANRDAITVNGPTGDDADKKSDMEPVPVRHERPVEESVEPHVHEAPITHGSGLVSDQTAHEAQATVDRYKQAFVPEHVRGFDV